MANIYTADISARIKEYRIAKKISQEKMAELLGITLSNYTKIENSYQNITIKNLKGISKVLDVSIDTLVFGETNKPNGLNFDDFIMYSKIFDIVELRNIKTKIDRILRLMECED